MNCVYTAYADHIREGVSSLTVDWHLYRLLKVISHGTMNTYTYGGCVPFIVQTLAKRRGLTVAVQHRIWTQAHYEYSSDNAVQRWMVQRGDFGVTVSTLTLTPAIYLPAAETAHAIFCWQTIPVNAMMALQLRG